MLVLLYLISVVHLEVFAEEVTTTASLSEGELRMESDWFVYNMLHWITTEWGSGWRGTNFLVEVEQTAPISPPSSSSASSNGSEDYIGELGSQEDQEGFTTGATTGASNATTVETGGFYPSL